MTEETFEGPTPGGGVRATIYYFDDEHRPVKKDEATGCEIVEFGADGNSIHRTYARLKPEQPHVGADVILAALLRARADGDDEAAVKLEALLDDPQKAAEAVKQLPSD